MIKLPKTRKQWVGFIATLLATIILLGQYHGWFNSAKQTAVTSQPGL